MDKQMVFQVRLQSETSGADWTTEGSLPCVDEHMPLKVGATTKALRTISATELLFVRFTTSHDRYLDLI